MSKNNYVNNHIECLSSYINRLERNLKSKDNQIESLRNLNTTIKLCNSDYYNQICTLSSKLSLINNFINEDKNCVPKHISDYVNKVLFDKVSWNELMAEEEFKIERLNNIINELEEDIVFCINGMKNEYACTDSRTNRELHTMVKILEESLDKIKGVDKE